MNILLSLKQTISLLLYL